MLGEIHRLAGEEEFQLAAIDARLLLDDMLYLLDSRSIIFQQEGGVELFVVIILIGGSPCKEHPIATYHIKPKVGLGRHTVDLLFGDDLIMIFEIDIDIEISYGEIDDID